ncbi:ferritin family protein [Desulfopila aestuarii]|uniref:Rubrerythrin n=1 Tax=Desulfopila aestuarii DSM 18488 TaxID=1121416 RepID=A0A1M7Y9K3_9BACT|nr:ferritin family protein [Desulfopila aestuarii]SHO49314.1 Rubrerythrin [Desulfopila aestuarii DSM 18488]
MDSTPIFQEALAFEEKIRDLYRTAESTVDDPRGKAIFQALAKDEQSHVDFLNYSLEQQKNNGSIDISRLFSPLPAPERVEKKIESMKAGIPERMLGDIKTVLNSALIMEKETSAFYEQAISKTEGEIRTIMEKFLEIEQRHTELVRLELDHAQGYGMWFDFMEINLEAE